MSELFTAGEQLRELLRGLLQVAQPEHNWGMRIDYRALKNLYAPQKIEPFRATPGGIDNLELSSTDVFSIPGKGDFEVQFDGYFQVARAEPTTKDWATSAFYVNMTGIHLRGKSHELGPISVTINPDVVSFGQVFPAGKANALAACRIAAAVNFDVPQLGATLFNKEPILLMNDGIKSVPPVEDPNGKAHIYRLPLYSHADANGPPIAYLNSLRYSVGNYISQERAAQLRIGPEAFLERGSLSSGR